MTAAKDLQGTGTTFETRSQGALPNENPIIQAEKLAAEGKLHAAIDLLRPWTSESPAAELAILRWEGRLGHESRKKQSAFSLNLLSGLLPDPRKIPGSLNQMGRSIAQGKTLRQAYEALTPGERAEMEGWAGSGRLREILDLSESESGEEFWNGVTSLAVSLRSSFEGRHVALAGQILSSVVNSQMGVPEAVVLRAQRELDLLTGQAGAGAQAEFLAGRFVNQATDWKTITPMILATPVFHMGRATALRGLLGSGLENPLTRGLGARMVAGGAGFAGETAFFSFSSRSLVHFFEGPVAWDAKSVGQDMAMAGLTLGLLKSFGFLGRQGMIRARGLNEANVAAWSRVDQAHMFWAGQASGYLGLVSAHAAETGLGLRPHQPGDNLWLNALSAHIALGIGGHWGRRMLGPNFRALEHQLALRSKILQDASEFSKTDRGRQTALEVLDNLIQNSVGGEGSFPPGLIPAAAGVGGASLSAMPSEAVFRGPSRDHIIMMEGKVDPKQSLGVLPTGSLTPHGDEVSTHQRAVGDKRWVSRVAAYNGHLKYKGDDQYEVVKADEARGLTEGQILTAAEAAQYFEEIVKGETGFRELPSNLPIETDWAGQIPTGFRGEEGKTEKALLELMGLTRSRVRELSFQNSGTLITKADQFALQGLFALYRSAVQWGVRLEEVVGIDPRQMGIAAAAGLGGMNNLVDLITSSLQRREGKDGQPSTTTNPPTGPLWLPSLLIDSMQGLFVGILGPKGDSYPATLARNSIIQTVGRIPVNVGACATGYKTFGDAADMFRPNWPGQLQTELAFFGSAEASMGRLHSRPNATGFNPMKAMETRKELAARGGRLEDGYAPLTKDVFGFWPSEGAGAGGLMRIHRMVELGLPIQAGVLGYSIMGDQGGKRHPAGLGLGGLSTMMESLSMMTEWQHLPVENLKYLSLHGTGTPDNNRVEPANLLKALEAFGFEGQLKLSAFKAFLGHGLGSAGSMEIALLTRILQEQVAPGAFHLEGRELDENVQALGDKVVVNSDLMVGDITAVGGQSQGFAGNNAAALFRQINDQVLHEVYGYSAQEIEAYRARESERLGQAREWEEAVRKGDKTVGEFLSWFGLGETPPEESTTVDMAPARGSGTKTGGEKSIATGPEIMIHKKLPLSPDKAVVLIGDGAGVTPQGSWRTTRRVTLGAEDAVAHKAWDAGLVRFAGKVDGESRWVQAESGEAVTSGQIRERFGKDLDAQSGIRDLERISYQNPERELAKGLLLKAMGELPVGSAQRNKLVAEYEALDRHPIDSMVADFAGIVPSYMRDTLFERMGMTRHDLSGTRIGGSHYKNVLSTAGDQTRLYLYGALEVLNQLGGTLPELYPHPRRVGFSFGAAFESYDIIAKLLDHHRGGGTYRGLDTPFPNALLSQPPAILANMLGPEFTYRQLRRNPRAIEGIVPPEMDPRIGPNTMGPVRTEVAACASGFYALAAGADAMIADVPGKWTPELFILGAADASLSPLSSPFIITAFSDAAPISRAKLGELGIGPAQASAPLTRDADGLVVSEAGGAIAMTTLPQLVARRQLAGALVAGWGTSLGEGGKEQLMGMDEGSVSATLEAINMGIEGHGMSPQDISVVQLHGTSTRLNNIAELVSLYKTLGSYPGERPVPVLNALKAYVGHSMGAASMLDLLQAVATLREQRIPPLGNFSMDRIDPRFENYHGMELQPHFRFPTETQSSPVEGVLGITQGFGSRNGAVLLRRFDPEGLRRYEWPGEWKAKVEDYIAAWPDIVAEYEARQEDFMAGKTTHGRLALENAYPNPALEK